MDRFVKITKNLSTGNYDVDTNANVSVITDTRLGVPAFQDAEAGVVYLGYKEDFTLVSSVEEFSQVKWWMDQRSGNGSSKYCYTTGTDSFEGTTFYQEECERLGFYSSVATTTESTITISGSDVTIDGTTYNFTPVMLPIAIGFSTCTSS